ncbi:hypothetical protein [Kitasatospora sp. NPDC098663]|uniref:hypothetical protein n=1 Tax=Kitasatospora sp. NPDC098663 TaxID=3364096 RepID=UPI00381EFE47
MSTETPALTAAEHSLIEYLREMAALIRPTARPVVEGWAYTSAYDLLFRAGRIFTQAPLPDGTEMMMIGHCFTNAVQFVENHDHLDLTYVEGFASFPVSDREIHTEHAWASDETHRAFDPTWPHGPGHAYIGLPIYDIDLVPHPFWGNGILKTPNALRPILRNGLDPDQLADIGRPLPPLTDRA